MKKSMLAIAMLLLAAAVACAQETSTAYADHAAAAAAAPPGPSEMTGGVWAKHHLESSPRHREWVNVKAGNRVVSCFVVYPEVKNKAAAVIVIHEIFGLTDWAQMEADEVAAAGYIAIAPDLLSGMGPKGGGTSEIGDMNAAVKAIGTLPPDQITSDLNAVADYVTKLPSANGKLAVAGFCWGGTQSFRFATNRPNLSAAYVFYGTGPDADAIGRIKAPVYGFYAGNDDRVGATIPATTDLMKAAAKTYEPVTYEGAGHGFMRAGDAPPPPADADAKVVNGKAVLNLVNGTGARDAYVGNKKARDAAWVRWTALLKKL